MSPWHVSFESADNGRAALEAVTQRQYSLVLMACQMPVMDGLTACAAIRHWEGAQAATGTAFTPYQPFSIMALTANAMEDDRERCLAAGMDDYLANPFSYAELAALLRRWLPSSATAASLPEQPGACPATALVS